MLLFALAHAQDVSLRDPLLTGTTATAVYGGSFTGAGWRVDDENSRLYWDLGAQVNRGSVTFTTSGITLDNLVGDNNEFIQLFDSGDKWSCTHGIEIRAYGDLEAASHGDIKLKTWDNTSGLYSEERGGVQVWDGLPHTWTVTWDTTTATLQRDGVEIVTLDVTGQDLSVGTMWLPLNVWGSGYSHPIGSVYSALAFDGWEPGGGGGDTGGGGDDTGIEPGVGRTPIEDVGVVEGDGAAVYADETDLPVEGASEAAYLMFDLSDLSGVVTAATLHLHAQSDSHASGDGGAVYAVSAVSWSEDTLIWDTRPALGAQLGTFGPVTAGASVSIDVTAGVTAGGRVSLALANGGGDGVHFWAKEGDVAPTLEVVVEPDEAGPSDTAAGPEDSGAVDDDTGRKGPPGGLSPMDEGGCGCGTTTTPSPLLLIALLGLRRRYSACSNVATGGS